MEDRFRLAWEMARGELHARRNARGWWEGTLASSALSTATAVIALHKVDALDHRAQIRTGLQWLVRTQTTCGGWGDTVDSLPNLSTTLLCRAAFLLCGEDSEVIHRCETWINSRTRSLTPDALARALVARYGKDRTFSVPIMMACALAGGLGPSPDCWRHVPQLPFELAALPRRWFAALQLPVVSYALPALIAIGQVRFYHRPSWGPLGMIRRAVRNLTLDLLRAIQPSTGGYLEATPLTAFVTMAMADMGLASHSVVEAAVAFLVKAARPDGAWPIDSNLATWATTLSLKALGPETAGMDAARNWLMAQQALAMHPYTLSAPGCWAWTDLPGGVPDADDTAGALLALGGAETPDSVGHAGVRWLIGLQNRDGGIPTFCRGWGALPFDRSTPEITAHALAAFHAWQHLPDSDIAYAILRAWDFLRSSQRDDGAWEPLWFGNQYTPDEANPVFGTATVLKYMSALPSTKDLTSRAVDYLISAQQSNGAWSGARGDYPPSVEETALATQALALYAANNNVEPDQGASMSRSDRSWEAALAGGHALLRLTKNASDFPAAPIGLYFAKLWYHEELYPLIFAAEAFRILSQGRPTDGPKITI